MAVVWQSPVRAYMCALYGVAGGGGEPWQCLCVRWRAATLPLMSRRVAETESLMHSGSSPLAATGLPRATADDSFNCFQSFRLVPAQWRRVLVCVFVHVWDGVSLPVRARAACLRRAAIVCGCCAHMRCVFDGCVRPLREENEKRIEASQWYIWCTLLWRRKQMFIRLPRLSRPGNQTH